MADRSSGTGKEYLSEEAAAGLEKSGGKTAVGGKPYTGFQAENGRDQGLNCEEVESVIAGQKKDVTVLDATRMEHLSSETLGRRKASPVCGVEEEKVELSKPVERRSQYHSIQQLSLPSKRPNGLENPPRESPPAPPPPPPAPPRSQSFYKLTGYTTGPGVTDEDDTQPSAVGADRDNDGDKPVVFTRADDDVSTDYWQAVKTSSADHVFKEHHDPVQEFSDEDMEFYMSTDRCTSDCPDDTSDVEVSDDVSVSPPGSRGELSSAGRQNADEFCFQNSENIHGSAADPTGREIRMEAKRARVEKIIKTMTPVNQNPTGNFQMCGRFGTLSTPPGKFPDAISSGKFPDGMSKCDAGFPRRDHSTETRRPKRKQYIPQQVDPRDQLDHHHPSAKVCIMQRDVVRNGLHKVRKQIVDLQQQYQQLLIRDREMYQAQDDGESSVENSEEAFNRDLDGSFDCKMSEFGELDVKSAVGRLQNGINEIEYYARSDLDAVGRNGAITGLEQLAEVLKAEITKGVERLVDNFVRMFMAKGLDTLSRRMTKDAEMTTSHDAEQIRQTVEQHPRQVRKTGSDGVKTSGEEEKAETSQRQVCDAKPCPAEGLVLEPEKPQNHLEKIKDCAAGAAARSNLKRKAASPHSDSNYHKSVPDVESRLPLLPPPLPIQIPFPVHGSAPDGATPSIYEPEKTAVEKYYLEAHNGAAGFGIAHQPTLPLFASHHLYYPQCIGKFPAAAVGGFLKEQDQLEPLPLLVGGGGGVAKKPKRTKVIDRVSPRSMRPLPAEASTPSCDDEPNQRVIGSHGKTNFHLPSGRFHPSGSLHDAFPHPAAAASLLPFGFPPGLHSPGFEQRCKFMQAIYSQRTGPTLVGGLQDNPASLGSPTRRSPLCALSSDLGNPGKSYMKTDSAEFHESMLGVSNPGFTSTLTPMHLRKAKCMFFYVRYPSSSILKVYFPDVKFNKNNTAQLVKWFSNFREFYYIQMEKYARQALAEGVKSAKELVVSTDAELYRILVVHYNRNCQIEVPENFRFVVQATLREFFSSIAAEKDQEPSWKKSIYKVIQRMDDPVPEYFKSPNWMERLSSDG